jgi:osmotically-inducible protein OsmY
LSKGLDIEVTTVDGVVSLDGKVKNSETMMHVQKLASGIKGVVEVDTTGLITE